jgi:hypothetical protein
MLIATCCLTVIGVIIRAATGGTDFQKACPHRSVASIGELVAQLGQILDANISVLNHIILGFDKPLGPLQLFAQLFDAL